MKKLRAPRPILDELDEHKPLYVDLHVALEIFKIRYPDYIAQTTPQERMLYGYYLALKSLKDERSFERNKDQADIKDRAYAAIDMPYR